MTIDLRRTRLSNAGVRRRPARDNALARKRQWWGRAFVAPAIILVVVIIIIPSVQALYYSFTDWNGLDANWIGVENYTKGLFGDPDFSRIALNSLFIVISVPFGVLFSLVVAYLLSIQSWGRNLLRTVYFLPIALSWVVIGITFSYLLSARGPIDGVLEHIGLGFLAQDWLGGETTALISVILVFNWSYFGINVVLLFTGMTTADPSVTEAARLDGASGWKMLTNIVIPQVRRYIELSLIVTMAAAITQIFGLIYTLTGGGPGVSTTTLEYALYTRSFNLGHFSQGAAFGILLFVVSLLFAGIRLRAGVRADDN
jgi:multiple sugar transport system permease protein